VALRRLLQFLNTVYYGRNRRRHADALESKNGSLMVEFVVRSARYEEAGFVTEMFRLLTLEMEQYGGPKTTMDESSWERVTVDIGKELGDEKSNFFIAETADFNRIGLAATAIVNLAGAFAPKKIIHLRFVYVQPTFRRLGVGSNLICVALEWGRRVGGDYCHLNVLAENPARSFYKKFGFSEVDINMVKPL
jgi:ribosomal protein S18 acetylase RimI-like enzyme